MMYSKKFFLPFKEGLIICLLLYYTKSSIIQQSVPQVAFKKSGLMIPNLSFANIKFNINTTSLFNGTTELCNSVSLLKAEGKKLKSNLLQQITKDLEGNCIENIQKVHEIQDVFGIKDSMYRNIYAVMPRNETKRMHTGIQKRLKVRQVVTAIVIGVTALLTSLYSIYTTNQLVDITSNNDNIVEDTNHIIEAIQDHDNRIIMNKRQTNRLKKHVEDLSKEVMINKDVGKALINAVAIKTISNSIARNLQGLENGLFELLKNRLSPSLLNLNALEKAFKKLQERLIRTGHRTLVENSRELLQSEASFVSYSDNQIVVLLHVML